MSTIHTRIAEKREAAGLTMQQLATAVGYKAFQTVQQWENGSSAPKRRKMKLVADALKTTVAYLQTGDESKPGCAPDIQPAAAAPPSISPDEAMLLASFRALSYKDRTKLLIKLDAKAKIAELDRRDEIPGDKQAKQDAA